MNKRLEENLIKDISPLNMERGLRILNLGRVKKISGKRIEGVFVLMASVEGERRSDLYSCVIRIDLKSLEVIKTSCQCEAFREGISFKKNYFCEHLASLSQGFILSSKRKGIENKDGDSKPLARIFKKLKFNVDFYYGSLEEYFIVNFVGLSMKLSKVLERDVELFLKEDRELVSFLKEGKGFEFLRDNSIKIPPNDIRRFLESVKGEKINLRFNYKNYSLKILEEELKLEFTLKGKDYYLVISDKVNHPLSLNSLCDSFIFEDGIYLISEKQRRLYRDLYLALREGDSFKIKLSDKDLVSYLEKIEALNGRVLLDYKVANILERYVEREFYFYKEGEKIVLYPRVKLLGSVYSLAHIKEGEGNFPSFIRSNFEIISLLNSNKFFKEGKEFVYKGDEEEYFSFLEKGIEELKRYGKVFFKDGKLVQLSDELKVSFDVKSHENSKFKVNLFGEHFNEFENIYDAFVSGESYYKTEDGEYINLKSKSVIEKIDFFRVLNIRVKSDEYEIHEGSAVYISDYLTRAGERILGEEIIKNALEDGILLDKNKIKIEKSFEKILRDYQKEGYYFFKSLSSLSLGGLLGDEMGLGKTLQAISFIASEKEKRSLIVAPTSLIYNWEEEFKKFAPFVKVKVIHGEREKRVEDFKEIENFSVIITSYGTLKNDVERYREVDFDYAFLDEAQHIKNPKTKVFEAVKEIRAKNRFALTGTPIENNLFELWAIFDFLMPGFLYSKDEFRKTFINSGEEGIEALESLIKPFILRRLKRDVLKELPPKIEKNIYVKMTERQNRIYKECIKNISIENPGGVDAFNLLACITKLRQICLEPSLVYESSSIFGGKIPLALEIIENEALNNNKVLVFSQFVSVFDKVFKELDKRGIKYYYLDGKTKPLDRVKLVKEFNEDREAKVFLISLKAGGTGLNLTSASTVIHLDPWWNGAVESQATDRAHRMGQKNVVTEIKLICKNSIEEEMVRLKESKANLIEDVLNKENLKLSNITKEDLLSLIR